MTSNIIFLFPHQDDEFGVFHAISESVKQGSKVWCVYLTEGGIHCQIRNQESLMVLKKLGVQESNILYKGQELGIADCHFLEKLSIAADWLMAFFISLADIEKIYVPAWEGGHSDHDALHAVTISVAKKLHLTEKVWQFSLYNSYHCKGPFFRVMHPLLDNGSVEFSKISFWQRIKFTGYCLRYKSQIKSWLGLFPFVFLYYIFVGKQKIQRIDAKRIVEKPHQGLIYYEYRGFSSWNIFQSTLGEFLNEFNSDTLIRHKENAL